MDFVYDQDEMYVKKFELGVLGGVLFVSLTLEVYKRLGAAPSSLIFTVSCCGGGGFLWRGCDPELQLFLVSHSTTASNSLSLYRTSLFTVCVCQAFLLLQCPVPHASTQF